MRTNIEIDDVLMKRLMKKSGEKTKRAVVDRSMRTALRLLEQGDAIRSLRGIGWHGDLDESRLSRDFDSQS